jgi:hypothetical protein
LSARPSSLERIDRSHVPDNPEVIGSSVGRYRQTL